MPDATVLENAGRLNALRSLPKGPDPVLDGLVKFAVEAAGASTAAVNLVGAKVVSAQAITGPLSSVFRDPAEIRPGEGSRKGSFCPQVVATGRALTVADTLADPNYAMHPMVYGPPHLRRYIGAPILLDGYAVGALCAFDDEALSFRPGASTQMALLADMVARRYAARRDASTDRNLVDCIPDGWGVIGDDLIVRDVNTAACRLLDLDRDEVVGRLATDFVAPEMRELWRSAAATAFRGSRSEVREVRTVLMRRSGERASVRIWLKIWGVGDVRVIGGVIRAVAQDRSDGLSLRQKECLRWAGAGKTDAEIALLMQIAPSTVHNHIEAAKRKLGVATRIQAILTVFNVEEADLIRSFALHAN